MKLLFYIHGLEGGGAERVMSNVVNGLCKRGHNVKLVLTYSNSYPAYDIDPRVNIVYLSEHWRSIKNRYLRFLYIKLFRYILIRREALKCKPDVAITFLAALNPTVILSLLGTGIPVIASEHTTVVRKEPFHVRFPRTILYPFASAITVLTQHDYEIWKHKYKNLVHMPNPCDPIEISSEVPKEKVVLAAGRVAGWKIKGFDTLVDVWNAISKDYPEWRCQIVGGYTDENLAILRENTETKDLTNVEFLGFRKDISEIMAKSEIFCLTSRVEGFPMVLIEAMNANCCCVSFDVPAGPSEIIEHGVSGLLVKNQDIDALQKSIRMVIENESLRKRFSSKARASVSKYASVNILDRWEAMLSKFKS